MVFIWLYCQRSLFCALVTLEREEQEGPVDWVSWFWNALIQAWISHPHRGGNGPAHGLESVMPGQVGSEAHLEWRGTPTWCKASSSWTPFPSSLVSPAAVALAGSQNSKCSAAWVCEWRAIMLTVHGKDFGIRLALLFPCSILGSDLPLAIVSKD